MSQSTEEEVFQPTFPALETCLMVDPRHSTRHELRKDLKASNLFENIVEAKSLDDGSRIASAHRFDAVFLGTSLAQEKALGVLNSMVPKSFTPDCAFIVLVPRNTVAPEPYFAAGAHRVIETPCPRTVFAEGVVRGVVAANANSPWTGIVLNADANGQNLFGEESGGGKSAGPPPAGGSAAGAAAGAPSGGELNRATLNSVIAQSAPGLKQLKKQLESGECQVDASGKPDEKTQAVLDGLLSSILQNTDLDQKVPSFRTFFQTAIVEWMRDIKVYGPTDAMNELRRKLLAFRP